MKLEPKIAILCIILFSNVGSIEGQSVYYSLPDIYDVGDFVQFYIDYYDINNTNGERVKFNESYGKITHEFRLTNLEAVRSNSASFENLFNSFENEIVYYNRYISGYRPNWLFTDLAGYEMGDEILEFQKDHSDAYQMDQALDTIEHYFIVDETEFQLKLDGKISIIPAWVVEMRFYGYSNWGNFSMEYSVDFTLSKTTGIWLKLSGWHLFTYDSGQIHVGGGVEAFTIAASGVNFNPSVRTRSDKVSLSLATFAFPLILMTVIFRSRFRKQRLQLIN